jgi:hypothetical protein
VVVEDCDEKDERDPSRLSMRLESNSSLHKSKPKLGGRDMRSSADTLLALEELELRRISM